MGAARAESAVAASVASRYALGANGVGAARPGARGSRVAALRYALSAKGLCAASPGACICSPPLTYACCLLMVGVSKTSCALHCLAQRSAQRELRAPAEGKGGVAHREELAAATSATLERSAGMVADRDGTRGRLASGVAPVGKGSRRRRAGCARPAGRGRLERASEDLWWWVVRTPTSNYLRLASPNRGKYHLE